MFTHYLYVSGTAKSFRIHCQALAKDAVARSRRRQPRVLDIAANDGTLLEAFRDLGCSVFGIDPAANLRPVTEKKEIPVAVGYWGRELAEAIEREFDIITATNVFAHVDDPLEFLEACDVALAKDGLVILEFPYCDQMITRNEFDTIYHEHLSYFLVGPLATLVARSPFAIADVMQTEIHGGSIRVFLRREAALQSASLDSRRLAEQSRGLYDAAIYREFAERVARNASELRELIAWLRRRGDRVIGYGASAKGNTLLNYARIDLDYIVDDNPWKRGLATPGRNIPVRAPSELAREQGKVYVLLLVWNFAAEILGRVRELRPEANDEFIRYVPRVAVGHSDHILAME